MVNFPSHTISIGSKIDISWNCCWKDVKSYEFLQNWWNPQEFKILHIENIIQKFGTVDFYSELLARIIKGQSVLHALSRIINRIVKYTKRGFTVIY